MVMLQIEMDKIFLNHLSSSYFCFTLHQLDNIFSHNLEWSDKYPQKDSTTIIIIRFFCPISQKLVRYKPPQSSHHVSFTSHLHIFWISSSNSQHTIICKSDGYSNKFTIPLLTFVIFTKFVIFIHVLTLNLINL